jgi:hypothetical protein
MRRRVAHLSGAALLVLVMAPGCRSKPLQELDGGAGVIIPSDAMIRPIGDGGVSDVGPARDGGGAIDAPWNVTFGGRRSFVVTAAAETDAGAASSISHTFTMMLDTDQRVAIIGKDGDTEVVPVEQRAPGVLYVVGTLRFGVYVPSACAGSLLYSAFSFTLEPSGASLAGNGQGTLTISDPALSYTTAATMVLTGVRDTDPPALTLSAAGDIADPWTPFWVTSSEPLPGQQMRPTLQSKSGDIMGLGAPTGMDAFVRVMAKPARLLRYSDEYRVALDGITDLDGNPPAPTTALTFTTRAPPPLVAEDGFESVTGTTLGGAQVLSGAGAPTLVGARSLYIPPAASLAGRVTQFALRLPILSGDTMLRFAYRSVNPGDAFGVYFVVASVGGTIGTVTLPPDGPGATTPATIDGTQVLLGPLMTATINLPGDAHGEVVLARLAAQAYSCGGPAPPPVPGLIIDDLYAE